MENPEQQLERQGQEYYSGHQYDKALPCIKELQRLGRSEPQLRVYEARCLYFLLRAPEAVEIMRTLLANEPTNADYRILFAQYLQAIGEFDVSLEVLQQVPQSVPGYHMLMGWHRVRQGDFLGGFHLFQDEPGIIQLGKRLQLPPQKHMQKDTDIRGKVLLYLLEGGFGDEIAFSRFTAKAEERGARVTTGVSKRATELFKRCLYSRDVREAATIPHDAYDYYVPAIYSIDIFGIADPKKDFLFPYLYPDTQEVARWKPVLERESGGKKKIGIHWQGNWEFDTLEMKSPPARLMTRFAELGRLFSLQRDAGGNTLPAGADVFDTEAGPPSWASTTAVISEMDYIVTNDTSTAHLAGALGKKTLVLLPHAPHIYWIMHPKESVWYPNMHTFRQPTYNDWEGAVKAAHAWLKEEIRV